MMPILIPMKRKAIIFSIAAATALVFASGAWALRFTDESYATPVGTVGSAYSFAFGGAGGCGPALPYQYSVISGSLPPGLALASTGLVSGTPTQAGSWSFWVDLSDQNPPSADWCRPSDAQREFTITINGVGGGGPGPLPAPAPSLSITTASLPTASVGSPYSLTLAASGGSGTKSWTLGAGSLPAGLSLASNGVLSGTPTTSQVGTYANIVISVSDGTQSSALAAFSFDPRVSLYAVDDCDRLSSAQQIALFKDFTRYLAELRVPAIPAAAAAPPLDPATREALFKEFVEQQKRVAGPLRVATAPPPEREGTE